jgi:N-methylhydantoinase A
MAKQVRIGIDVGGTFTHAVAIDAETMEMLGRSKVPTTHKAAEGVAKGIIDALQKLLDSAGISPDEVTFIAHSTTQATNALLEGDVAPVGIIGMGKGASAFLARMGTAISAIELAPGKHLKTFSEFIDTSKGLSELEVVETINRLKAKGAQAIAVSEAFSVDEPLNEDFVLGIVRKVAEMPATSGSEVSKLYGLKVRTRTAVINAAMLPKMIETANMTESSVRAAGIKAPIMIMRSDGGVMDIEAMRSRPILTMLSGPAAGVAAAMMYLNISDGIFLEVGGTSTDISVIRNGKALVKGAEIGGHRVYMRTLDVKTLGVAGGSMLRTSKNEIIDVGPRSAHIAGLGYVSFGDLPAQIKFNNVQPQPSDPPDYLAISGEDNVNTLCLTPTCASNFLGLVPEADCARGNLPEIERAFNALGKHLSAEPKALAELALRLAFEKCLPVIRQFMVDYKLDPQTLTLVGGGGGAAAIVPFVAKSMNMNHALAENADVISAIGVALALVRETVERNIVQPKPEDILRIREEAYNAVQKMGADPSSIEIHVEVDPRANVVRATAFGAAGLQKGRQAHQTLTELERVELAAKSMRVPPTAIKVLAKTPFFEVFSSETVERKFFGLLPSKFQSLRTMDDKGIIRLQTRHGDIRNVTAAEADRAIMDLAEQHAQFGDAGRILPDIMLLVGARIVDLSGVPDAAQIAALARTELSSVSPDAATIVIAAIQ